MQASRHIGIDLHRDKFTCCVRLQNGRTYLTDWRLEDLPRFIKKLRRSDEIAVEVTGNTRLFRDAVAPHVARVVAVRLARPSEPAVVDIADGDELDSRDGHRVLRIAHSHPAESYSRNADPVIRRYVLGERGGGQRRAGLKKTPSSGHARSL